MKVLFVDSNIGAGDWKMFFRPGLANLSASLKKAGHKTDVFLVHDESYIDELLENVSRYNPKVIGFTATESTFEGVTRLAKLIRKKFPSKYLICGGTHCIVSPEEVIKVKEFDAVCTGEGDHALPNLCDSYQKNKKFSNKINNFWFNKGGKIIKNRRDPSVDISKLPFPDREVFHEKGYGYYDGHLMLQPEMRGGTFLLSRGCPFNCAYCCNHALKKSFGANYYRVVDPKRGIEEILEAQKKYHYDYISFTDDTFTLNKKWFHEFIDLYAKEVQVPFVCQLRIGTFSEEEVIKLKNAGCYYVMFGLESGDETIRKLVLNRNMSDEEIYKGMKLLKDYDIKVGTYNLIGVPGDTPWKHIKTLRMNALLDVDFTYRFVFYPFKKTHLYYLCKEKGYLTTPGEGFVEREDSLLALEDFPKEDIIYYFINFYDFFALLTYKGSWIIKLFYRLKFWLSVVPPSWFLHKITKRLILFLDKTMKFLGINEQPKSLIDGV
jgi:anaerobic magnesium-protoporphyrin IX monomethyl ester cyclase